MNIAGIDPGISGGIATKLPGGMVAEKLPIIKKTKGSEIDIHSLIRILKANSVEIVYLEKMGIRPGEGARSGATAGINWGTIYGALIAVGVKVEVVTPQRWKGSILAGTPKDKDAAIGYARRNYPEVDLIPRGCRTPQDGIADAVCICVYGVRNEGGK
jgi:crossover junction endodeoxyribonuclease RuvC